MTKTWVSFYDDFLHDVPDCSYFAAANALRRAAQEFCERTKAWRVTLDPVILVADVAAYDFDLTGEQQVVKVLSAKLGDQGLDLLLHEVSANVRGFVTIDPLQFQIQPTPTTSGEIVTIVANMMPSNASTGVDDFLYAAFAKDIAKGAKADLFGQENQPFSNPAAAMRARLDFDTAIGNAAIRAAKAFSSAPLRVQASFM